MKIALAAHADAAGGASRATLRLHQALLRFGHDSTLVVARATSGAEAVAGGGTLSAVASSAARRAEAGLARLQRTPNPTLHSAGLVPGPGLRSLRSAKADLVNIHWINSFLSVGQVRRLKTPVVMTLHDMWAFCGAEHYAPDGPDARWRTRYAAGNRPDGHSGLDLDRWAWRRKVSAWTETRSVVAPTRWLAECVRASALMSDWPVAVIPNPLPLDVFKKRSKAASREDLSVSPDIPVIAFGALGATSDVRKGFDLLLEALHTVASSHPRAQVIVFGQSKPSDAPRLPLPVRWLGHIADEQMMAVIYNAADVMVVPSRQDNLPQTGTEAQACGTPVVAFDVAGLPDVVVHKETGYLAHAFDAGDLARGIDWILDDPDRRHVLGEAAARRAAAIWCSRVIVPQYEAVYRAALSRAGGSRSC